MKKISIEVEPRTPLADKEYGSRVPYRLPLPDYDYSKWSALDNANAASDSLCFVLLLS